MSINYKVVVAGNGEFKTVGEYGKSELPKAIKCARDWKKSQPSTVTLYRVETTEIDF